MAIKTKAEIERQLTIAAKRARQIREAAEALKGADTTTETETTPSEVNLVKPTFSPLIQR